MHVVHTHAQEADTLIEPEIILRPTIPAYYQGCSHEPEGSKEKENCSASKVISFIGRNLKYPVEAKKDNIEGIVVMSFVVSDSGDIQNVDILRDIGYGCGDEAKRILNKMPRWQAALYKGKQVATKFTMPISFQLGKNKFDYSIQLDTISGTELSHQEIIKILTDTAITVKNPSGEYMKITELNLKIERGGEEEKLVISGNEVPDEKVLRKFFKRKPGRLTIDAYVVERLDIRKVNASYLLVKK